jgi:hypothetical protein
MQDFEVMSNNLHVGKSVLREIMHKNIRQIVQSVTYNSHLSLCNNGSIFRWRVCMCAGRRWKGGVCVCLRASFKF